ncbi:hypothetical protein [Aeromonas salmonicida]|uniref:hypothetical protein n=1 Tax=Aeromonas salmonicida TaxID=645 RepID=UPI00232F45D4|nr:hypothetical protein [Aeromonas salmonicida]WCH21835.1 hypothetical protein ONZ54_17090 [Aeromonas salmonicida]
MFDEEVKLVRYKTAMQPKVIETLRGRWDELVYTLPLGVDTNSAIKLELGYLGGHGTAGIYLQG